jgi:hypothetical protein
VFRFWEKTPLFLLTEEGEMTMREQELARAAADAANLMYWTAGVILAAAILASILNGWAWYSQGGRTAMLTTCASLFEPREDLNLLWREERRRERDLAHDEYYRLLNNPPLPRRNARLATPADTAQAEMEIAA